jgi:uncharacterized membrane protein YdjX (TVP38/TMEM64 family)
MPHGTGEKIIQEPVGGAADQRPLLQRLGPAGPLALLATFGPPVGLVTLAVFSGPVAGWLREHHTVGVLLYVVAFAVLAGFALLPTHIQCALAGYAFGLELGAPVVLLGIVGAAVIGYEVARRASGDRVLEVIDEKPRWRAVRDALVGVDARGHGFWRTLGIVTLVRIPPNSPFALTNLVMASVKVPRPAFLIGTVIGIAPRTLLAVYIGAGLQAFTKDAAVGKAAWVFWTGLGITLVVLAVVVLLAQRAINRLTKTTGNSEQSV